MASLLFKGKLSGHPQSNIADNHMSNVMSKWPRAIVTAKNSNTVGDTTVPGYVRNVVRYSAAFNIRVMGSR